MINISSSNQQFSLPVSSNKNNIDDKNKSSTEKIQKYQKEFIDSCKRTIESSKNAVPIIFNPVPNDLNINPYKDKPNILHYGYVKKVVAMIPHLNFPNIKLCCKECPNKPILTPKQFTNNPIARLCHGYHEDFYVLTYKYACKQCGKRFCSSVLDLDDYASSRYGLYFNKRLIYIYY